MLVIKGVEAGKSSWGRRFKVWHCFRYIFSNCYRSIHGRNCPMRHNEFFL